MESIIDYRKVEIERADRLVMKEVSFSVSEGEFCYLVGKVGSGKSSLLKTMLISNMVKKLKCSALTCFI